MTFRNRLKNFRLFHRLNLLLARPLNGDNIVMKFSLNRFYQHLRNQPLASVYLISGDEVLLVEEASNQLREKAFSEGFLERKIYDVDTSFDWNKLFSDSNNLALFSEKMLIELHIAHSKLGLTGKKLLLHYLDDLSSDQLLLIISNKLESQIIRSDWVKRIEKIGIFLPIWPVTYAELPQWIRGRLSERRIKASPEAVQFLANQSEGNLLAAQQWIEKLCIMMNILDKEVSGEVKEIEDVVSVSLDDVISVVTDQGHYSIFDLVDYVLLGDVNHVIRIIHYLREEGSEPVLILWALTRELRTLIKMVQLLQMGKNLTSVLNAYHVFEKRKAVVSQALKRFDSDKFLFRPLNPGRQACVEKGVQIPAIFSTSLQFAFEIDCVIKGLQVGNVWQMIESLCLTLTI